VPQGTIKDYDSRSRTGTLITDDRQEVLINAGSVEGSGLRFLRVGQRVKFDVGDEGGRKVARTLRIVTLD
jgi:2-phospho-L-lactate/phosphoenolpyruvate guanylyltransferase